MLEIPESKVIAEQLEEVLRGKRIEKAAADETHHGFAFYCGDPADYPSVLEGCRVQGAWAYGGQVTIDAGDSQMNFADGATLRYTPPGDKVPVKRQFYLAMEDGSVITGTTRMYGSFYAYRKGEFDTLYMQVAREKPSPLSDAFDEAYFERLWRESQPKLSAKAFLATEQRIPGLGNGVLQDILFRSGVHPKSKLAALDDGDRERMFKSVKTTLVAMSQEGGRDTEKDLFGRPGGYRTLLSQKTYALPCLECGGPRIRQAYLGGNVYFCPVCQPLKQEKKP